VDTNPKTRESRLFSSTAEHVVRSAATILRAYTMYRPLTFFLGLGAVLFAFALIPFVRFLILVALTSGNGGAGRHVQSLIVGSVIMIAAIVTVSLGVIADLIRINRTLLEDSLEQQKRQRFGPVSSDVVAEEVGRL
jgi:hypothetical protein